MHPDANTLASIASIIAGFGSAMIIFRIQREQQMHADGERVWLPVADWLLIAATVSCLLGVIVPISATLPLRIPAAASAMAAVAIAGYLPSILAHYRIVFGASRTGPRDNPEPFELILVLVTAVAAVTVGAWVYIRGAI